MGRDTPLPAELGDSCGVQRQKPTPELRRGTLKRCEVIQLKGFYCPLEGSASGLLPPASRLPSADSPVNYSDPSPRVSTSSRYVGLRAGPCGGLAK